MTHFLLNLDTRRSTSLFILFLVIGSVAIAMRFWLPYLPIGLVSFYGLILFIASIKYVVAHSDMTKSSPYFLAFSFFLVALFSTFHHHGGTGDASELLAPLGAALLPTILGLAWRQVLFAYDPTQREEEEITRSIRDELRENAVEFKRAQQRFVDMTRDLCDAREGFLKREEEAVERHIQSLAKTTAVFSGLASDYPKQVSKALSQLSQRMSKVLDRLQAFLDRANEFDSSPVSRLSGQLNEASRNLDEIENGFKSMASSIERVRQSLVSFPEEIERAKADLSARLADSTNMLSASAEASLHNGSEQLRDSQQTIAETVDRLRGDIEAMDEIVTTFAELLEKKIHAVGGRMAANA